MVNQFTQILLIFYFQFAESSITQLEKTRSSQQSQIQSLQIQVQSLQTTVDTMGQFLLQLFEKDSSIDIPDDVRRIVQQIGNLDYQRKKPIFVERKIGKSLSINGFPLKVLEELNENMDNNVSSKSVQLGKSKSQFFENTYNQLRKQNRMRPTQLEPNVMDNKITTTVQVHPPVELEVISKETSSLNDNNNTGSKLISPSVESVKSFGESIDSGIATPITPKENIITSIIFENASVAKEHMKSTNNTTSNDATVSNGQNADILHHPFGNCEDVNFKFNGTTQLKSLRPLHLRTSAGEKHIDSRS